MTGKPRAPGCAGLSGRRSGPPWDGFSKLGMQTLPPCSAERHTQNEPLSGTDSGRSEAITTALPESKIHPQLVLNYFVLGFKIC